MGYGRKQSQEGFPEEAAMKLKEQKDRDGHPGRDGGTHAPRPRARAETLLQGIRAGQAPGQGARVPEGGGDADL